MDSRGLSDSAQARFDRAELGERAAAALFVENMTMRPYSPSERAMRRFPGAEDAEEVVFSMLTSVWRRHGVGRSDPRLPLYDDWRAA